MLNLYDLHKSLNLQFAQLNPLIQFTQFAQFSNLLTEFAQFAQLTQFFWSLNSSIIFQWITQFPRLAQLLNILNFSLNFKFAHYSIDFQWKFAKFTCKLRQLNKCANWMIEQIVVLIVKSSAYSVIVPIVANYGNWVIDWIEQKKVNFANWANRVIEWIVQYANWVTCLLIN